MAINYWRVVGSDHDNHTENQCLQCYGRFLGYAVGWVYCPLCGTRWLGQQQQQAEDIGQLLALQQADYRNKLRLSQWFIQVRSVFILPDTKEEDYGEWRTCHQVVGSAREALDSLKFRRSISQLDEHFREEFRVVLHRSPG